MIIYTLWSYEDSEIKEVTASKEEAEAWIAKNRNDRPDDIKLEKWEI